MLAAVFSLGGIGLLAAVALGFASKKFAVEVDPRELAIVEVLSGANCGACGYPGCAAYAKAVADGEAAPNLCTPGGQRTLETIAHIMGVAAVRSEPQVAVVLCQGDNKKGQGQVPLSRGHGLQRRAEDRRRPQGVPRRLPRPGDLHPGLPFRRHRDHGPGAGGDQPREVHRLPEMRPGLPRSVIAHDPAQGHRPRAVQQPRQGGEVRKYCQVGCIACQICEKTAPEAYMMENFLARVLYESTPRPPPAVAKCPTKCIRDFTMAIPRAAASAPRPCR